MFDLILDNKVFERDGNSFGVGLIKIESFDSPYSYWSQAAYLNHWYNSLIRLIEGKKPTALITSMHEPDRANFIFWWVLYPDGDIVHIQNHVLFIEKLASPFSEKKFYYHISEREFINNEGQKISEWV